MGTEKMERRAFLKASGLGMMGIFCGLPVFGANSTAEEKVHKNLTKTYVDNWKSPWHPEVPKRLCDLTHELARQGLSGEWGAKMTNVSWKADIPKELMPQHRYALSAMSVAENAPLRIEKGSLVVGSATLIEGTQGRNPVLRTGAIDHVTVGFEPVLNLGFDGLRKEIRHRLATADLDEYGKDLNESALLTLDAVEKWNSRNIELIQKMEAEAAEAEKPFYRAHVERLSRVPKEAPRNFHEAVQSLWTMYAFFRLMGNWMGIGRIDKMLGPYLKKDLKSGKLTLDEAREILAHFWINGTEWIGRHQYVFGASGDAQFYQNIILGGIDKHGNEVTNEVTYLVLDIVEELHISDFPIAVRLGKKTPEKLFRRIAEVQRYGGGIVSVYSEDTVIEGLVKLGVPLDDAREYTNDGCWEAIVPGKSSFIYTPNDMLPSLYAALKMNEDAKPDYPDFESLYASFCEALESNVESVQKSLDGRWKNKNYPCCLASIFTEGCLEKGVCYAAGGAIYPMHGIHFGGVSDVVNSLYVIKKLVYEDNYLTLNEFVDILKNNWDGHETLRQLIKNRFDFYGNDAAAPDEMMQRVFNDYAEMVGKTKVRAGLIRPCGISTFGREIDWRMRRLATPEGSRLGDILATNCSPTPGSDKKGPTSAINSYCKLDFTKTCSGATLELKILPSSVKGKNGIDALAALMKTFRDKGGYYMHIDVVDTAMLIDAQKHPERYPNLPVRVSGWSARFTTLGKEWQDMVIQRTQQLV